MSRRLYAWRDDLPDAEDLALLEAEILAATVDPNQPPMACVDHIPPGLLCPSCFTTHDNGKAIA